MNDHYNLPPHHQLARPSRELDRRMDALFAAAVERPTLARGVRRVWWVWFVPAGLAGAAAAFLLQPARPTLCPRPMDYVETRELPASLAAELLPPVSADAGFSVSICSY